ncbi:hypothetical protein DPMN_167388 [Dreissena polymorpha]|uniref:Uncharacterized protein n=1 Tax=Dreissena polymorpha TaxID=45954 RepID=A0A9D4IYR7_DREPO|nr:hypothetical protein DPMN_167388 [Dreissena polymorpha]
MYSCLRVDHVESLSLYLLSLNQLETLNIVVYNDIPSLWNAFRGLTVKRLSLDVTCCKQMNHIESFLKSLSSLKQLETLCFSTCLDEYCPGLWEGILGLNIKDSDTK